MLILDTLDLDARNMAIDDTAMVSNNYSGAIKVSIKNVNSLRKNSGKSNTFSVFLGYSKIYEGPIVEEVLIYQDRFDGFLNFKIIADCVVGNVHNRRRVA